jgi:DNA-directed RNA polymerase specialized sigma subunit
MNNTLVKRSYKERIDQILPLLQKSYTAKQIASEIGVSKEHVHKLLKRGREDELLPDNRQHNPMRYMSIGALGREIKNQDPSFTRWLQRTMPEGTTIASFAVACMLDTYYEDLDS